MSKLDVVLKVLACVALVEIIVGSVVGAVLIVSFLSNLAEATTPAIPY